MRSVKVGIIGSPNVGKSSFINTIMNNKICIVSSSPHSTREPVLAVTKYKDTQIIFVDTPGISDKKNLSYFNKYAEQYLNLVCLFFFDATKSVNMQLMTLGAYCSKPIALFNKIDKVNRGRLLPKTAILSDVFKDIFYISCLTKENIDLVLDEVIKYATEGEEIEFETSSSILDRFNDRAYEVLFRLFKEEIPYHLEVTTKLDDREIIQTIYASEKYRHIILGKYIVLKKLIKKNIEETNNMKIHYELKIVFD